MLSHTTDNERFKGKVNDTSMKTVTPVFPFKTKGQSHEATDRRNSKNSLLTEQCPPDQGLRSATGRNLSSFLLPKIERNTTTVASLEQVYLVEAEPSSVEPTLWAGTGRFPELRMVVLPEVGGVPLVEVLARALVLSLKKSWAESKSGLKIYEGATDYAVISTLEPNCPSESSVNLLSNGSQPWVRVSLPSLGKPLCIRRKEGRRPTRQNY